MSFAISDARLAAMLAEDAPYGDVTTLGLGIGAAVLAAITSAAVEALDLKPGDTASAIIKASGVIIGKH